MNVIAAVDNNWSIGYQNRLLVRIPNDQKNFHDMTKGKVVVMGRKTLESLPQKQPLANRINIILTRNQSYMVKDAVVVHSINELMNELKKYDDSDIFVAGGESIYKQLLPYCDFAYITKIDFCYQADTYFPRLDKMPDWELIAQSEEQTYFDLEYYFFQYRRKNKRKNNQKC